MNKKLAQIVVNEMNKKADSVIVDDYGPAAFLKWNSEDYVWEYNTEEYDFVVSEYDNAAYDDFGDEDAEGNLLLQVFEHGDREEPYDEVDGNFTKLKQVEEYIKKEYEI